MKVYRCDSSGNTIATGGDFFECWEKMLCQVGKNIVVVTDSALLFLMRSLTEKFTCLEESALAENAYG